MIKPIIAVCLIALFAGCSAGRQVDITDNDDIFTLEEFEIAIDAVGSGFGYESAELLFRNSLEIELVASLEGNYTYPVQNYLTQRTLKTYGQFIAPDSGDRFSGYHTGDDVEVDDVSVEVPVNALIASTVVRKQYVSGYGGVVVLEFEDNNIVYHALYGHLDLDSVTAVVGDTIPGGEEFGVLGDHESTETDGERKHLHFGIYQFSGTERFAGYVEQESDLVLWENPVDFFQERDVAIPEDTVLTKDEIKDAIDTIIQPMVDTEEKIQE